MPPLSLGSLLREGGGETEDMWEAAFSASSEDDSGGGGGEEECGDVAVGEGGGETFSPAGSLWLRIGEDIDWSEVGAVLEREDSTKGASNPKSSATRNSSAAPAARTSSSSSSCAGGGTPTKAVAVVVIAGLPPAAGKISREHGRSRRRLGRARARAGARVFAGEAVEAEPGSPKVSCLGGVRSRQPCPTVGAAGRRRWWLPCLVNAACRRCWNPRV
ncbi:hypothetical protein ABZP36_033123 [Zizania latifolia]